MLVGRICVLECRRGVKRPQCGVRHLSRLKVQPVRAEPADMLPESVPPDLIVLHMLRIHRNSQEDKLDTVVPAQLRYLLSISRSASAYHIVLPVHGSALLLIPVQSRLRQTLRKSGELSKVKVIADSALRSLTPEIPAQLVRLRKYVIVVTECLAPGYRPVVIVEKRRSGLDFQPRIPTGPETVDLVIQRALLQLMRFQLVYGIRFQYKHLRLPDLQRLLHRIVQIRHTYT